MGARSGAGREIREMSGRRVGVVLFALLVSGFLSNWLLQDWIERRFGLPAGVALVAAVAPGAALVTLAVSRAGWGKPILDVEERRRAVERSLARDRRTRRWLILSTVLMLVPYVGSLLGALAGYPSFSGQGGLVLVLGSVVMNNVVHILPTRGEALCEMDARDQALRHEAMRMGYLVLLVLGTASAAVAEWRPVVGAECWGPTLLASVLVAQVWITMLSWRPAVPVPAGAD